MSAAKRQRKRERKGNTGCAGDGAGGSRKSTGVKSVNEVCCETVREARYGFANSRVRYRDGDARTRGGGWTRAGKIKCERGKVVQICSSYSRSEKPARVDTFD